MSDTKLRPEDLTSEERALFHQVAIGVWLGQPGAVNGESIDEAFDSALRYIEFSRALFAPAPGEAAKVETHICEFCSKEFEEEAIRYGQATLPTPAPPEPAAHEDAEFLLSGALSMARIIERDERAAPEMPEAVTLDGFLTDALEVADAEGMSDDTVIPTWPADIADMGRKLTVGSLRRLSNWWRTSAQPVAVGMTEELEELLRWARDAAGNVGSLGYPSAQEDEKRIRMMIDKVRQQAAQPVRLEKVPVDAIRRVIERSTWPAIDAMTHSAIEEVRRWLEKGKGEGRG